MDFNQHPSTNDSDWLMVFEVYIEDHLEDSTLTVFQMASHFLMSESTLLRKVKQCTGLSPNKYLQEARLTRARDLFEEQPGVSVSEVARSVGYVDPSAFSRLFYRRFGIRPSEI